MNHLERALAKDRVHMIAGLTHELVTYAADIDDNEFSRRVDWLRNAATDVQKWLMYQEAKDMEFSG